MKRQNYPIASWSAPLRGDLAHASMTSADIEASEAAGTRMVAASDRIPLRGSSEPQEQAYLRALGFVLGEPLDSLFRAAQLPPGWTKQPSPEDSRTTMLLDAQGRRRGYLWYKAAWYDQDAYMGLYRRYQARLDYGRGEDSPRAAQALDGETVLWRGPQFARPHSREEFEQQEAAEQEACAWLDAHYPEWRSPVAYWDNSEAAT